MKEKVAVFMSGGTDSSVAAALLIKQGYDVFGVMLKLWQDPTSEMDNTCCGISGFIAASKVCNKLNIPFYVLDARKKFYNTIVNYYINQYEQGYTPNPCILCNRTIRFEWLSTYAKNLGADYVATGHYVQNIKGNLHRGMDIKKDQSYMLYGLKKEILSSVLFPVGGFLKDEVKQIARSEELPIDITTESQGICFIPDQKNIAFLKKYSAKLNIPGPIVNQNNEIVGQHTGLLSYTIGQRHGIPVSLGYPAYVLSLNLNTNSLIIGPERYLYKSSLIVKNVNWHSKPNTLLILAQIRYHHTPVAAYLEFNNNDLIVHFSEPVRAVTPGQSVVFYNDSRLLGGGIIDKAIDNETIKPPNVEVVEVLKH